MAQLSCLCINLKNCARIQRCCALDPSLISLWEPCILTKWCDTVWTASANCKTFLILTRFISSCSKFRAYPHQALHLRLLKSKLHRKSQSTNEYRTHSSDDTCDATYSKCRHTSKKNIANANARCEWTLTDWYLNLWWM